MVGINVTVGPKGQIVIPAVFRNDRGIYPGDEITVKEEGNMLVIVKRVVDKEQIKKEMEEIARINSKNRKEKITINSDKDYEEMLEERWAKSGLKLR